MPANDPILESSFLRKLDSLTLAAKRPFIGQMKGEKRSLRKGNSIEFTDYREYTPGDDLRYVDWNMAARTEKLFLKLFVEEEDILLALLIDTSMSMDYGAPNKLRYALQLGAALGYVGLVNYDRVTVQPYASGLSRPLPTKRGRVGVPSFFTYLQQVSAGGSTDFTHCLHRFSAASKSKGIAILISDFFDPNWKEGMKSILARGFQVVVFHILSPDELTPSLTGDLRIVDSESGESREMSITPALLSRYKNALQEFSGNIQEFCRKYGADYLSISTEASLETVTMLSLRKMGILR